MTSSAPPAVEKRPARSPFAGPDERGRQLWRAGGEAVLAAAVVLLTYLGESEIEARLAGRVPALAAIGIALVLVRRRFPVVGVVGLAALMAVAPAAALLTAVAAYTAARQWETTQRRVGLLLGAAGVAMVTGAASAPALDVGNWVFGLALGAVLAVTTVVVPGLVGTAAGQQDRLLGALRERAAAAEEARLLADSEARVRERTRIAAEMHDLVGHRLSVVSLYSDGLEMVLRKEAPGLRDEAAVVGRAAREAMRELREVLGVLGPVGQTTGGEALTDATGTRADIEALVEESRGAGIPLELDWDGPDLDARPARVRRAVHRVVREALTNVHRYAAGAHVTVSVRHAGERVEVQVRNGVPPVPPVAVTGLGTGRGLIGLRERVALLGGCLEAGRTPGGGFTVTAGIPAEPGPGAESPEAAPYEEVPGAAVEESGRGLSAFHRRLGGAVVGLVGLVGVSVMMLFGVALVDRSRYDLAYQSPEKPRLGMEREQVERAVGPDNVVVRAAAAGREPPRPRSATHCLYPYAGGQGEDGKLDIVRYCFRADTLIAIDRFTVPTVTEPPHGRRTHD
ncbi:histidine kinase [Streptomyces sp. RS10V-4]|uniref:sensor histidine kinase n=1 Tax=Streptomyces rhizoryzae TaxID=2932493 RepID=UPI002004E586|nr:histidine kinase [Streptomyces rhizoryzae]MCK7625193.1 histidine kinase [Streptomyces rhizoryzae]